MKDLTMITVQAFSLHRTLVRTKRTGDRGPGGPDNGKGEERPWGDRDLGSGKVVGRHCLDK